MVAQVLVEVQVGVVPEHDDHRLLHPLDAGDYECHYILKIPTKSAIERGTYFLPRGRRSILKQSLLNQEKKSSHGAKSYECGPVNII